VFGWVWRGRIRSPFVTGRLGLVQAACARLPPITPDFGRVKTAEFCTAESGVYSARFWQVFGRALERPAGGADADAQFPGDDLPRGAGRQKCAYLARVDGDWRIAGAMGVYQYLSMQDLYLTTLARPTVCGSSISPNQKVCLPGSNFRVGDNPGVIRWRFESKCRVWPLVATARNLSNGRKTPKTFGGLLKFHLGQAFETKQSKASRACGQEVLGLTAGTRLLEARTDSSSINDGAVARGCLRERSCAVSRT
jgi:hypothetical protein